MAAQFAVDDDSAPAKPKKKAAAPAKGARQAGRGRAAAWSPLVAQAKR